MKYAVVTVLALGLIALLVYGGFSLIAKGAEKKSNEAWRSVDVSGELDRLIFVGTRKNESAARVEELALPLGIDLSVRRPAQTDAVNDRALLAIAEWLHVEPPTEAIRPLPPEVSAWLESHGSQIETLSRTLTSNPPPVWQVEGRGVPHQKKRLPNLRSQMLIAKLLSVSALEREAAGDQAAAWEREQALWVLARGLLDRPEVISRLIGVAQVRMLANTMRKLEPPAPAWTKELFAYDFIGTMKEGVQLEFAGIADSMKDTSEAHHPISERIESAILGPYLRWGTAESRLALATLFASSDDRDDCGFDAKAMEKKTLDAVPLLARPVSRMTIPFSAVVVRATIAELSVESASKVLLLKEARNASAERKWPAAVPGIEKSDCSAVRWSYLPADGGSMQLLYNGRIPQSPPGQTLNFDFTVAATPPSSPVAR